MAHRLVLFALTSRLQVGIDHGQGLGISQVERGDQGTALFPSLGRGQGHIRAVDDPVGGEDQGAVLVRLGTVSVRLVVKIWAVAGLHAQQVGEDGRLIDIAAPGPEAIDFLQADDLGA